ncbi:MAG TPA: MFS transporter [Blastocatellia bacterium]|nr:MFS transporter [Blastocatellia bacterium]
MNSPATKRVPSAPPELYTGFVLSGAATTMLGPLVPLLASRWQLTDAQAGSLFTVQFTAAMSATLGSGRLVGWLGMRRVLVAGYSLIAAGMAGLVAGSALIGTVSVLCYGLGLGLANPITNLAVSETNPDRRAAALNLLNFIWGIGAVASPLLIALAARSGRVIMLTGVLALLAAAVALRLWRAGRFEAVETRSSHSETSQSAWRNPLLPLNGVLIFLYGGTEMSIAGWVTAHTLRLDDPLSPSLSAGMLVASVFWTTLLAGRAMAPLALRRLDEQGLVLAGLVLAAIGQGLLLRAGTIVGAVAGTGLAGLGLAAIFPTTVALLPVYFGTAATQVTSLIFALGGLGGAVLPWSVGIASTRLGSLRTALLIPLLAVLLMIGLQLAIRRLAVPLRSGEE